MGKRSNRKRYLFTSAHARQCQIISTEARRKKKEEFLRTQNNDEENNIVPVAPRYSLRERASKQVNNGGEVNNDDNNDNNNNDQICVGINNTPVNQGPNLEISEQLLLLSSSSPLVVIQNDNIFSSEHNNYCNFVSNAFPLHSVPSTITTIPVLPVHPMAMLNNTNNNNNTESLPPHHTKNINDLSEEEADNNDLSLQSNQLHCQNNFDPHFHQRLHINPTYTFETTSRSNRRRESSNTISDNNHHDSTSIITIPHHSMALTSLMDIFTSEDELSSSVSTTTIPSPALSHAVRLNNTNNNNRTTRPTSTMHLAVKTQNKALSRQASLQYDHGVNINTTTSQRGYEDEMDNYNSNLQHELPLNNVNPTTISIMRLPDIPSNNNIDTFNQFDIACQPTEPSLIDLDLHICDFGQQNTKTIIHHDQNNNNNDFPTPNLFQNSNTNNSYHLNHHNVQQLTTLELSLLPPQQQSISFLATNLFTPLQPDIPSLTNTFSNNLILPSSQSQQPQKGQKMTTIFDDHVKPQVVPLPGIVSTPIAQIDSNDVYYHHHHHYYHNGHNFDNSVSTTQQKQRPSSSSPAIFNQGNIQTDIGIDHLELSIGGGNYDKFNQHNHHNILLFDSIFSPTQNILVPSSEKLKTRTVRQAPNPYNTINNADDDNNNNPVRGNVTTVVGNQIEDFFHNSDGVLIDKCLNLSK